MSYQKQISNYLNSGVTAVSSLILDASGSRHSILLGYEDNISNQPITETTLFDIASLTKLFTATVILKLMEEMKLDINTKVGHYMGNFQGSELTITDLLTHRAKFDLLLSEYRKNYPDNFKEALLQIRSPENQLERVEYHNLGYIYLGFIIEKITGLALSIVFENLFRQLGFKTTTTGANMQDHHCVATEETIGKLKKGVTQDESAELLGGVAGNAGIFSTANDLAKFAQMWLKYEILSRETQDRVFKNYGGINAQSIGWWGRTYSGNTSNQNIYCHPGFSGCLVAINRSNGKAGVLLSNRTYFSRENKAHRRIFDALIEELK